MLVMHYGLRISQYGGYALHDGHGSNEKTNVCLHLGLTDYRSLSLFLSVKEVLPCESFSFFFSVILLSVI